jgi:hypothetical protein
MTRKKTIAERATAAVKSVVTAFASLAGSDTTSPATPATGRPSGGPVPGALDDKIVKVLRAGGELVDDEVLGHLERAGITKFSLRDIRISLARLEAAGRITRRPADPPPHTDIPHRHFNKLV